jgi:glutathione S-transferase
VSGPEVTLYCATIDADCLAARLLLGALSLPYRETVVDVLPGTDVLSRQVLTRAPGRSLPLLQLGDQLIGGLVPVLLALAEAFDPEGRQLEQPADGAHWLEFAVGPLRAASRARTSALSEHSGGSGSGPGSAADGDADAAEGLVPAREALLAVEDSLATRRLRAQRWIAGDQPRRPSLADFALYPAIALSRDFGLEHHEFPAIRRWLRDVRLLAPTVAMPGILDPI